VYACEWFIHDRGKRQGAEGLDARLVDELGVLVLAFELEREVVNPTPVLVIPMKEGKRVRAPNPSLELASLEHALRTGIERGIRSGTGSTSMLKQPLLT
jgi:hypothetical protein